MNNLQHGTDSASRAPARSNTSICLIRLKQCGERRVAVEAIVMPCQIQHYKNSDLMKKSTKSNLKLTQQISHSAEKVETEAASRSHHLVLHMIIVAISSKNCAHWLLGRRKNAQENHSETKPKDLSQTVTRKQEARQVTVHPCNRLWGHSSRLKAIELLLPQSMLSHIVASLSHRQPKMEPIDRLGIARQTPQDWL